LVAVTLDISMRQAQEVVAAAGLGVTLGPMLGLEQPELHHRRGPLPKASLPPVDWCLHESQMAYCVSRGISKENMRYFGLATILGDGSGSKADYALAGRVMFPAWDRAGKMVWWVARAIEESRAKTINMPRSCREDHEPGCVCYHDHWGLPPVADAATADEVVLGLHLVRPGERVIVVEGPVDAAVCGPGFVSVNRAWISVEQAALIAATGASEAVILFDGDNAGEHGAARSLPILGAALPTRIASCPAGEDPASLGQASTLSIVAQATSGSVQQLRTARYISVAKPNRRPPLQDGLNRMKGSAKYK
jgi:hypothetical protein